MTFNYPIWKDVLDSISNKDLLMFFFVFLLTTLLMYWKKCKSNQPPGPNGVPILGYIPFLSAEPYRDLDRLKRQYGNVFSLYMGRTYVVILGDYEAVKDAFSKSTTTDRPTRLFDLLPDGVGFSSINGEEWIEQRKFCVRSMRDLGVGKDKWEEMIQAEVDDFIDLVSSFNGEAFGINPILVSSVSNNISYFVLGKRLPRDSPDRKFLDEALDDVVRSFAQSSLSNFFPIIRDVSIALGIGTYAKVYKKLKRFNNFFRREVAKIKETYKSGEHESFIVDYLKEMDNNEGRSGHHFNETNLYGNIQALFTGGSDTTRTSLHWLLLVMANYPDIQAKVHQEIDSVLGKDGKIRWSERKSLPFTYATIMEGQRWRTIAPLNTARLVTEDTKILNYNIPKGTVIIANNWGLHNDPKYWKDPEKFDPERFLTVDKQIIMKPDSYNAFSYGRRNCPGETIAMIEMLLYFTGLLQKFTVLAPKGKKLNMEGNLGLTYQAERQKLHFVPRGKSIVSENIRENPKIFITDHDE